MRRNTNHQKASAEKVVKDIRRATRRQFGAEEKIRIVLEGLRGEDSIAELCRREVCLISSTRSFASSTRFTTTVSSSSCESSSWRQMAECPRAVPGTELWSLSSPGFISIIEVPTRKV